MTSLLSVVSEPRRLMVTGALSTPRTSDEVAHHTGLGRRDVLEAIGELRRVGLVAVADDVYELVAGALQMIATAIPEERSQMDALIGYGMTDDERVVLGRFFSGMTLAEIPASLRNRLVVLQRLAIEFEPGRRYVEAEVNTMLATFHHDVAALRRALVDHEFLDRAKGEYWRSGGRAELGDDRGGR